MATDDIDTKIQAAENKITAVEEDIEAGEVEFRNKREYAGRTGDELAEYLKGRKRKEEQLRRKEEQLRREKEQLMKQQQVAGELVVTLEAMLHTCLTSW